MQVLLDAVKANLEKFNKVFCLTVSCSFILCLYATSYISIIIHFISLDVVFALYNSRDAVLFII